MARNFAYGAQQDPRDVNTTSLETGSWIAVAPSPGGKQKACAAGVHRPLFIRHCRFALVRKNRGFFGAVAAVW